MDRIGKEFNSMVLKKESHEKIDVSQDRRRKDHLVSRL